MIPESGRTVPRVAPVFSTDPNDERRARDQFWLNEVERLQAEVSELRADNDRLLNRLKVRRRRWGVR